MDNGGKWGCGGRAGVAIKPIWGVTGHIVILRIMWVPSIKGGVCD